MTAKVLMPVRTLNLVAPLAHEATDMHTTDTAAAAQAASGAARTLIGPGLRHARIHSATSALPTPGTATTTATRTTTTGAPSAAPWPSADSDLFFLLARAYEDCRRTKRNSASALAFEARAERHLFDLCEALRAGTYRPGRSVCFVVQHPRPREVWAAQFRDRVVHWLLYHHIAPAFHARFIADSCACIPGRGTLYAAERLQQHARSATRGGTARAMYRKADLANFFVSIDKAVLMDQLRRYITEPWWLQLAETIVMHDPRADVEVRGTPAELAQVPPHKSLFNAPTGFGLPIGNLSSQFFANVLLDPLDQFVKHQLRARHYVRYVDDFVLLHDDPAWLTHAGRQIDAKLAALNLRTNPAKTIVQPISRGIDFVGQVIYPTHRVTRRRTLAATLQRVATVPASEVHETVNSYFGLLRQASHSHTDRASLANAALSRGHCVDRAFTKAFRKRKEHTS